MSMSDEEKEKAVKGILKVETSGHREVCALCGADIHAGHGRVRFADGKPAHNFCVNKWQKQ